MAFDRAGAKAAGYTDQEIDSFLAQQNPAPAAPQPNPVDRIRTGPAGLGGAILGALPAAGGVIGGLGGGAVGGAFGMGLGLPEGVALGSGLGTAGGEALRESVLRGMGYAAPESSGEAARNILGSGAMSAASGYGSAKALEVGGQALKAVGTHPAVQQAIRSLGARFMRLGGVGGEVAEKAGEIAARTAPKAASEVSAAEQAAVKTVGNQGSSAEKVAAELAPAEEKTAAGQAAKRTVKPGAKGAKGKPLPGSAESRIKVVPRNAGQAGKSTPKLIRQGAANADDLASQLQKSIEFESEMAHRGLTPEERAIARKLMARGVNPFQQEAAQ